MSLFNSKVLIWYKNKKVFAEAHSFGRNGRDSPGSIYFRYDKRWISPFEQIIRGHDLVDKSIKGLLNLHYGGPESIQLMQELIGKKNPFLNLIQKDPSWSGAYLAVSVVFGDN